MHTKYSVVDIETTGSNRDGQRIIEIAIINFDGNEIEEVWSTLINPERPISYFITNLTGITNEMVSDAPKFYEVAKKIVTMTEGRTFVAHNVFFDYRFIQREFNELGFSFRREVFCTCRMARVAFKDLASYSLKNLCHHFNITQTSAHRALSDTYNCLDMLKLIQSKLSSQEPGKKIDQLRPAQLEEINFEDYPQSHAVYFMYDGDDNLLYVGKSKNLQNRIRQHFKGFNGTKRDLSLKLAVKRVDFIETFHDLPTDLLELQMIKTLKPSHNRASRASRYQYGLKLAAYKDDLAAADYFKVTKDTDEISISYLFRSKLHAQSMRNILFRQSFGLDFEGLGFEAQFQNLLRVLGPQKIYETLKKEYFKYIVEFGDTHYGDQNWSITFDANKLMTLTLNGQNYQIIETPDMRKKLLPYSKLILNEMTLL